MYKSSPRRSTAKVTKFHRMERKKKAKAKKKPKEKKAAQVVGGRKKIFIAPAKAPLLIFATNAHTSVRPRMDVEKELPPNVNMPKLVWLVCR